MDTFLLALIAGTGFALASLTGLWRPEAGRRLRGVSIGVAAGILFALAIAELFPEAVEEAGHGRAVFGFIAGVIALFVIEALTKGHTHHDADEHLAGHTLWPFVIGLGFHNLIDGLAIGASAELSSEAGTAVALGVLIHQVPVGISLAAVFAATAVSRRFFVRAALGLGLCIPLGGVAIALLPELNTESLGTLAAAAAGALVYIGAGHLLPETHAEERTSLLSVVTFPVVLVVTAYLFVEVLPHSG